VFLGVGWELPMEKVYQVFVSSTYEDLISERNEVLRVLLKHDCFPSGMELFYAADEDQLSIIKRVIDEIAFYVLIVGNRYGSIYSKTGVSFTETEYDYAVSQGIPVLAFINPEGLIPRPLGRKRRLSGAMPLSFVL
jgi:hypothetical protein